MQDSVPHFLRFTRTLAVGSALTLLAGCGSSVTAGDVPNRTDATASRETGVHSCLTCQCLSWRGGLADSGGPVYYDVPNDLGIVVCEQISMGSCCATGGPLPPPELV